MPLNSGQDAAQTEDKEGERVLWAEERVGRTGFRPDQASTGIRSVSAEGVGQGE